MREEGGFEDSQRKRDAPDGGHQHRDGTDGPAGWGPGRAGDDQGEIPDEVADLIEEDDEFVSDDRVEQFGTYAGGSVVPVIVIALFVGPWRLFDFSLSAGAIPFVIREADMAALSLLVPLPVLVLIGVVAGATYRVTTPETADGHRSGIVFKIMMIQLQLAVLAYLLLLLVVTGFTAMVNSIVNAVVVFVAGIVGLLLFSFFELLTLGIAVGILAYIGVLVGDGIGIIAKKANT